MASCVIKVTFPDLPHPALPIQAQKERVLSEAGRFFCVGV